MADGAFDADDEFTVLPPIPRKLLETSFRKGVLDLLRREGLISKVAVHGKYSAKSDNKLKDLGVTKYVKTSDGSYERTVGKGGPKMIREPDE